MIEDCTALGDLREAVQKYVHTLRERPTLVDVAILTWEEVSFAEDGTPQRQISYCIPTDNFSLTSALGLLEASREYVRRDILGTLSTDEEGDE